MVAVVEVLVVFILIDFSKIKMFSCGRFSWQSRFTCILFVIYHFFYLKMSTCLRHVFLNNDMFILFFALQLSKCVLAQWPLKCIKFYESTGMGQFGFETGKQSPSGEGKYFFNTRRGQDNQIYDMIDSYVMEADAFRKVCAEILHLLYSIYKYYVIQIS